MNIPKTRVCMVLEIDWEQNLRAMHKRPSSIKPGTSAGVWHKGFTSTLNSRIKEIRKMIASGEASYK